MKSRDYPTLSAHRCGASDASIDNYPSIRARHSQAILAGVMALTLVLTWRGECWAYIDPNAGGFLAQILAPLGAVFLSFLFYCRRQIRRFVKSVRDRWKGIESHETAPEAKE